VTYQERTSLDSDLANFMDLMRTERDDMHPSWEPFVQRPPVANRLVWAGAVAALAFTAAIMLDVFSPATFFAIAHCFGL
jgi:hypothetical protein